MPAAATHNQSSKSFVALMQKQVAEHEKERRLLQAVREEHARAKERLVHQQDHVQNNARTAFLAKASNCHGVELEYIGLQKQLKQCRMDHDAIQIERQEIEQSMRQLETQWDDEVLAMGRQAAKQELYTRRLQDKIKLYNDTVKKRQAKLDILKQQAQSLVDEADWKRQQIQACKREMKRLEDLEQQKNDIIQQLGNQVRSQLTRVS